MTDPMNRWAPPEGPAPAPPAPTAPGSVPTSSPAPQPLVAPKKQSGRMTNVILVVAGVIAIGGVAFAIGRATAPAAASGFAGRFANGQAFAGGPNGSFTPGQGGPGGFGARTVTITGTVKSFDGSTLVLTTANGTEETISVAGSTYHSQAAATSSDVTTGATVQVSVEGFGGFRGGPNASAAPAASGAPPTGTITAKDVMVTSGQ